MGAFLGGHDERLGLSGLHLIPPCPASWPSAQSAEPVALLFYKI